MIEWLHQDLTTMRNFKRWTIVLINLPIFLYDEQFSNSQIEYFSRLQNIFKNYNVDLIISSGGNCYKRTMPISDHIVFPFKNYGNENNIKKCYSINECNKMIIIEPEAPIYILEGFKNSTHFNSDISHKNGQYIF